ncbi:MAG: succinyl-diaminopimelate desuccinylase [Coxiellaceae bacterium]|nr:succinyl-diaminopimelate desuccinylase [Coxiellaceae bacterium]
MNDVVELASQLINKESVTPNDNGCQTLIADLLTPLGFEIQTINQHDVNNLWARIGNDGPLFVFSGHTDVVPPGPADNWHTPPFVATEKDNSLYGRGAADMKSAIAAMVVAVQRYLADHKTLSGSIAFAITSDEEGPSEYGSKSIVEWLQQHDIKPDYCLIGEASSDQQFGDMIKVGRRGSLHGHLTIRGKQGHIAYPQKAINPIQIAQPAIAALYAYEWDQGCDEFLPTSFQMSNCHSGVGAKNVIPGEMMIDFNFRYNPQSTAESLKQAVHNTLDQCEVDYSIDWSVGALPFSSPAGKLRQAASDAIKKVAGITTTANTVGGTSDGRFFAPLGCEIVEVGPINASIHQVNEHINIEDLRSLVDVYHEILRNLFD